MLRKILTWLLVDSFQWVCDTHTSWTNQTKYRLERMLVLAGILSGGVFFVTMPERGFLALPFGLKISIFALCMVGVLPAFFLIGDSKRTERYFLNGGTPARPKLPLVERIAMLAFAVSVVYIGCLHGGSVLNGYARLSLFAVMLSMFAVMSVFCDEILDSFLDFRTSAAGDSIRP